PYTISRYSLRCAVVARPRDTSTSCSAISPRRCATGRVSRDRFIATRTWLSPSATTAAASSVASCRKYCMALSTARRGSPIPVSGQSSPARCFPGCEVLRPRAVYRPCRLNPGWRGDAGPVADLGADLVADSDGHSRKTQRGGAQLLGRARLATADLHRRSCPADQLGAPSTEINNSSTMDQQPI